MEIQGIDMKNEQGTLLNLPDDKEQINTPTTISRKTEIGMNDGHVSSSDSNDIINKSHVELQNDARIDLEHEVLLLGSAQERLLSLICESNTLCKIPLFDGQQSTYEQAT